MKTQHNKTLPIAIDSLLFVLALGAFTANALEQGCSTDDQSAPLDPLIVDLGQDGIHLGEQGVGVIFDIMANGNPMKMQWTAYGGNDAFVVLDKNGNGVVDDGSELLTNYNTLLLDNTTAPNGFADLAQYDHPALGGNDDGFITSADEIWSELNLWLDTNADGFSTPNEMHTPASMGVTRLNTVPKDNNRTDPAGNLLPLWAWAKGVATGGNGQGHNKYKMVDVFFKALP